MTDNPLRDFYGAETPPSSLRTRVDDSLRRSGAIASRTRWLPVGLVAAALIAAAVLGYVAGSSRPAGAELAGTYVLLLHEDSTHHDSRPIGEIVSEYGRWADSLASAEALVLAERLEDRRYDVVATGFSARPVAPTGDPTGMFVIRARDSASAIAIARGSPHVRQGGRVVVRPLAR